MNRNILYLLFLFLVYSTAGCKQSFIHIDGKSETYYIDSVSGNDNNDGMSEDTPWKSFNNIESLTMCPGDSILLKAGTRYNGCLIVSNVQGTELVPVVIGSYGEGPLPAIVGQDGDKCAVLIYNCSNIVIRDLDISNYKKEGQSNEGLSGITVRLENYGTAYNTVLRNLHVHDINGTIIKSESGPGIKFENKGDLPGIFDGILIEDCIIKDCSRNGIVINNKNYERENWNPHRNVTIRRNLLEGVPGDGILPIGCDGTLIEYNIMRDCPDSWNLNTKEAAAGIWPWSSDNTIIQFNEVADHKATWDGQAFDSDYNCKNTTIRYNYSHDNYGGFLLICDFGDERGTYGVGNNDIHIIGNISYNDGIRPYPTPRTNTWFAPIIHISGPAYNTEMTHNIIHCCKRENPLMDHSVIEFTSWSGYPDKVMITDNIFFSEAEPYDIVLSEAKDVTLSGNQGWPYPGYKSFLRKVLLPVGEITTVDKKAIDNYFSGHKNNNYNNQS